MPSKQDDIAERGRRADQCYNEFLGPALRDQRKTYADRIIEIAASELDAQKRADKLTALSIAIKILDNIESAIRCLVEDGKMAQAAAIRFEEIERMSAAQRRLREFLPH